MDGGRGGARSVARGALAAGVIVAAMALTAGSAMANDRSTDVACIDPATAAWRASMTFSSIDVTEGHPVVVRFGSATATLAEPGPDGSATLSQDAGGDQATATWAWSIARNGTVDQSGSASFHRPEGCEGATPSEPPPTEPPPPEPPATEPPATVPPATPAPPGPSRPEIPAVVPTARPTAPPTTPPTTDRAEPLPVTGAPAGAIGTAAVAVAGLGALVLRWTKRRADQLIGD